MYYFCISVPYAFFSKLKLCIVYTHINSILDYSVKHFSFPDLSKNRSFSLNNSFTPLGIPTFPVITILTFSNRENSGFTSSESNAVQLSHWRRSSILSRYTIRVRTRNGHL